MDTIFHEKVSIFWELSTHIWSVRSFLKWPFFLWLVFDVQLLLFLQQEGQLCAQHCLNALLQGPFYTAVDLATLANQLDEEERRRMTEGLEPGMPEYATIVNQPSSNMDDTGFFSVQVR